MPALTPEKAEALRLQLIEYDRAQMDAQREAEMAKVAPVLDMVRGEHFKALSEVIETVRTASLDTETFPFVNAMLTGMLGLQQFAARFDVVAPPQPD